jgi:PAS domain S-box-containing protein
MLTQHFGQVFNAAPDGLVVVDSSGRMLLVNAQLAEMFGYEEAELIGREVEELMPEARRVPHRARREQFETTPKRCVMASGHDLLGRRQNGTEFPIEVSLSPLRTANELLVIASVRDISERKRASDKLQSLLESKKLLLKELHHRTKNNMQVMSSLLSLRKHTITEPTAAAAFAKTQDQLRAMALVHDLLGHQDAHSRVDLREYCTRLIDEIRLSHSIDPAAIRFHVRLDRAEMSFDTGIRVGLILNELIANSLKHAFPTGTGDITVELTRSGETAIELTVADNGTGLPDDLAVRRQHAIGLQLVSGLVHQLGGTLEFSGTDGTTFTIRLPHGL